MHAGGLRPVGVRVAAIDPLAGIILLQIHSVAVFDMADKYRLVTGRGVGCNAACCRRVVFVYSSLCRRDAGGEGEDCDKCD